MCQCIVNIFQSVVCSYDVTDTVKLPLHSPILSCFVKRFSLINTR